MITPVNGHLLIEPLTHDSFISSQKDTYEEIGIVISNGDQVAPNLPNPGDRVYFDSWLAAKYPKEGTDSYYWLVKWEDVRAVEYAKDAISK